MFPVIIVNPKQVLFEGQAERVFLQGDQGEFEILDYHSRIISLLRKGRIVIDGKISIPIKGGIARFNQNNLVVLAES